jgi:protein Tex
MINIAKQIALELSIKESQVIATIKLIDEGSTVPFIARYRKEVTDNLDDTQLRNLEEKLIYYKDLEERKILILASIEEQGKLNEELKQKINSTLIKQNLEDIYLPYKPKRRTKAQIAIEHGLQGLANILFSHPDTMPELEAAKYITEHVLNEKMALDGARDILAEQFAEQASLLELVRSKMWQHGVLYSSVIEGDDAQTQLEKLDKEQKFKDYYAYSQLLQDMPSHRLLAVLRGRNLGVLNIKLEYPNLELGQKHPIEQEIANHLGIKNIGRNADIWLNTLCKWTWKIKLQNSIELDLINKAREKAEQDAINIFAQNLKQMLMAAPAGKKATLGLDPGIRTGIKVAVIDDTGKLVETTTIYPFQPKNDVHGAMYEVSSLIKKHNIELIAIGNGTGGRETDKLVSEVIKNIPAQFRDKIQKIIVNESGASIYSASELAAKEFPNLDVSLRGAASIARRLQDPLAELVKIPPESIGVGQYQHDINSKNLAASLSNVVEDCVNAVGVDVNTASYALLERVSGINPTLAKNIVAYRDEHGRFASREQLKKIPRLGDKTFEQAAGFLRINDGLEPLDASAVHPESYSVAYKILANLQKPLKEVLGNVNVIKQIDLKQYINENCGRATLLDILSEFEKPGRDPRPEFKAAKLTDGVNEMKDLSIGMLLEGTITNVTAFGAFVDIGVHQDGLLHISELKDGFVANASDEVKAGQIVKVRVVEVDISRKRIALSMRLHTVSSGKISENNGNNIFNKSQDYAPKKEAPAINSMANAFSKLKR